MSAKEDTIEFEQLGVGGVLKRYRLEEPPNQRDFAWTSNEVQSLLEDITFAISSDEPQHFLGSIVTIRKDKGLLEVVDGQQRLATTALILAAMRHIVGESSENLGKLIEGFLFSIDEKSLEEQPNLKLNSADTAVFHDLIVHGTPQGSLVPNRTSHELLINAYNITKSHLQKVIAPLPQNEKWTAFQDWIEYLHYKTKIILLMVSSTVNAFRMFETLNDRGLKVSQSDMIKNYIFGQSGNRISDSQQLWASIRGTLEALDDNDVVMTFIRHALIATNGFVQQKDVYDRIRTQTKGTQSSVRLLSTWDSMASDYVAISNPESSAWSNHLPKVRDNLRVLNLFNIQPLKPILLAVVKQFSAKEAATAFEKVVAIGVRLIIASRTTSQSVEKPLSEMARKIWEGEIVTASQMTEALSSTVPNDQQFREAFEVATVSKPQFARYYLRSLELAAKGEPDPWLIPNDDATVITLEHVLPLKPEENWPQFTDDDVKTYAKRIGNLALLRAKTNSDLKSLPFSQKREALSASPYVTTAMIGERDDWLPENVRDRQQTLAGYAIAAWPLR
ncbi:MAG: DUF262 domain-containing HNH endonuclease family protein [Pseudomonadota bacterium]